jgi:NAD(P)-dependent dehydrogenase (short-subunit alcohol dehydrogenase family)
LAYGEQDHTSTGKDKENESLYLRTLVPIDLSSPSSIKNAVAQILRETSQIDVLMNSAGIMALPKYSTASMLLGHLVEMHLATNHLGHFLFTSLLFPALRRDSLPRIVNVTSTASETTPFFFSDYSFSEGKAYNPLDSLWTEQGSKRTVRY